MGVYLFIGGSADGNRLEAGSTMYDWNYPRIDDGLISREVYRRQTLATEQGDCEVYVIDSMSHFEAMKRLVEYYSPNEEESTRGRRAIELLEMLDRDHLWLMGPSLLVDEVHKFVVDGRRRQMRAPI